MKHPIENIEVRVQHPHGDFWVPLSDWIKYGPGDRVLLSPVAARAKATQLPLPLDVIPLQYRNTAESRRLIETGALADPWPRQKRQERD